MCRLWHASFMMCILVQMSPMIVDYNYMFLVHATGYKCFQEKTGLLRPSINFREKSFITLPLGPCVEQ
jgi:hypothetical protein